MIHTIPDSVSVEKSGRTPLTPLSPSTSPYKRANSLFVGSPANAITKVLLAQQPDNSYSGLSRPKSYSQVWDSAETTKRTTSRLLEEWKRKEMWQDLKRAEENVVAPASTSSRESENPSPYKRAASDARLETLLQTLQAEVAAPSRREEPTVKQRKEARRSPLQRQNSSHTDSPGSESDQESVSLSRRSRTSRPSVASSSSTSYPSSPSRLATVPAVSPSSPVITPPSVPLSEYEELQQEKSLCITTNRFYNRRSRRCSMRSRCFEPRWTRFGMTPLWIRNDFDISTESCSN
eukprot:jgi/Phyca11/532250/estExt2_fgenesh1_pg.C_PHYCAscaffold_40215